MRPGKRSGVTVDAPAAGTGTTARVTPASAPPVPARTLRWSGFADHKAPVAQLDRASVYGTEGREFESLRARQRKSCTCAFSTRPGQFSFSPRNGRVKPRVKVPHHHWGVALYDPRRPRRCARPGVAMNPSTRGDAMSDRALWLDEWVPDVPGCTGLALPDFVSGQDEVADEVARRARMAGPPVPEMQGAPRRSVPHPVGPRGLASARGSAPTRSARAGPHGRCPLRCRCWRR